MRVFVIAFAMLCSFSGVEARAYHGIEKFKSSKSEIKVLVFLSRGCPCSRSHVEHIRQLSSLYPDQVEIFGVITDQFTPGSEQEISDYYNRPEFTFPLIRDDEQLLIREYQALKTPHVTLLQRDQGRDSYQVRYQGGLTNERDFARSDQFFLQENLAALTQGKPPVYTTGKSLGCYIRRI